MIHSVPLIGIPSDVKAIKGMPFHCVGEKYIGAVAHAAKCFPLMFPAIADGEQMPSLDGAFDLRAVLGQLDGLFLAGSVANIDPVRYGAELETPDLPQDTQRDETTLQLIHLAIEMNIPILAVCRGFQELNVAFGGTLHQQVQEVDGYFDHREDSTLDIAGQYNVAHNIHLTRGGLLEALAGTDVAQVNSIHGQGIDRLGDGLLVEARAPDGLIEAVRLDKDDRFVLGVQWHPEWRFSETPFYEGIFKAFGDAVRQRKQS